MTVSSWYQLNLLKCLDEPRQEGCHIRGFRRHDVTFLTLPKSIIHIYGLDFAHERDANRFDARGQVWKHQDLETIRMTKTSLPSTIPPLASIRAHRWERLSPLDRKGCGCGCGNCRAASSLSSHLVRTLRGGRDFGTVSCFFVLLNRCPILNIGSKDVANAELFGGDFCEPRTGALDGRTSDGMASRLVLNLRPHHPSSIFLPRAARGPRTLYIIDNP